MLLTPKRKDNCTASLSNLFKLIHTLTQIMKFSNASLI